MPCAVYRVATFESEVLILSDSIGFLLLIQFIMLALNAIFASAEIAVLSFNETKLEKMAEDGNKRAGRLRRLTSQPERFLATIQIAITLSGFLGSAFASENFSDSLANWLSGLGLPLSRSALDSISVVIITLILSYVTLIFGELVPKRVAMKKSEQVSLAISGLLGGISALFRPVVWLLSVSTNAVLRLIGIDPTEEDDQVSEEEIRMMVDAGSEKGAIDHEERTFIQNVFEFDDLTAGEIATHRTDVTLLWVEDSDEEWASTIHDSRFTFYPICDGSPDEVVGVLNSKIYLRMEDRSRQSVMARAVKPAYFVPDTIKADVLFRNMKKTGNRIAIVLDEYGGMSGIITLNDLIEELVGDLKSEEASRAADEPRIDKLEDGTLAISGNVPLRDIEDALDISMDSEDSDTFTGYVFEQIGMIPEDGEQNIDLDLPEFRIHVSRIEDHQVAEATVQLKPKEPEES